MRENAILPQRATPGSAGLDLCACIDAPLLLPARGHAVVPTGIAIELPEGTAGFVFLSQARHDGYHHDILSVYPQLFSEIAFGYGSEHLLRTLCSRKVTQ